jgi:hypothetical protein
MNFLEGVKYVGYTDYVDNFIINYEHREEIGDLYNLKKILGLRFNYPPFL